MSKGKFKQYNIERVDINKYKYGKKIHNISEIKEKYFENNIIYEFKDNQIQNIVYKSIDGDCVNNEKYFIVNRKGNDESYSKFKERFNKKYSDGKHRINGHKITRDYYTDFERDLLIQRNQLKKAINEFLNFFLFEINNNNNNFKCRFEINMDGVYRKNTTNVEKSFDQFTREKLIDEKNPIKIEKLLLGMGDLKIKHFNNFIRFIAKELEKNNFIDDDKLYEYIKSEEMLKQIYSFFLFYDKNLSEIQLDSILKSNYKLGEFSSINKKLNSTFPSINAKKYFKEIKYKTFNLDKANLSKNEKQKKQDEIKKINENIKSDIKKIIEKFNVNALINAVNYNNGISELINTVKNHYQSQFKIYIENKEKGKEELINHLTIDTKLIKGDDSLRVLKLVHQTIQGRYKKILLIENKSEQQIKIKKYFKVKYLQSKIENSIFSNIQYNIIKELKNDMQNDTYINSTNFNHNRYQKEIIKLENTFKSKLAQNISPTLYLFNNKYNKNNDKNKYNDLFGDGINAINEKCYYNKVDKLDIDELKESPELSLALIRLRNYLYHVKDDSKLDECIIEEFIKKYNIYWSKKINEFDLAEYEVAKLNSNAIYMYFTQEKINKLYSGLDIFAIKKTALPRFHKLINHSRSIDDNYIRQILGLDQKDFNITKYNAIKYLLEEIYNHVNDFLCSIKNNKYFDTLCNKNQKLIDIFKNEDIDLIEKQRQLLQLANGNESKVKQYQIKFEKYISYNFGDYIKENYRFIFDNIKQIEGGREYENIPKIECQCKKTLDQVKNNIQILNINFKYIVMSSIFNSIDEISSLIQNTLKYKTILTKRYEEDDFKVQHAEYLNKYDINNTREKYLEELEILLEFLTLLLKIKDKELPKYQLLSNGKKGFPIHGEGYKGLNKRLQIIYDREDLSTIKYKQYIDNENEIKEQPLIIQEKNLILSRTLINFENKGFIKKYLEIKIFQDLNNDIHEYEDFYKKDNHIKDIKDQYNELRKEIYKLESKVFNEKQNKLIQLNKNILKHDYLDNKLKLKLLVKKIKFEYELNMRLVSEMRKFDQIVTYIKDLNTIRNRIDHYDYLNDNDNIFGIILAYHKVLHENNFIKERNALKEIVITIFRKYKIDFSDILFKEKIIIEGLKPKVKTIYYNKDDIFKIELDLIVMEEIRFLLLNNKGNIKY